MFSDVLGMQPSPNVLTPILQDLTQLRKLAAVRGLVNSPLRARCWPLLCGPPSHAAAPALGSTNPVPPSSSAGTSTSAACPPGLQQSPAKPDSPNRAGSNRPREGPETAHDSRRSFAGGEWHGAWAERARQSGPGKGGTAVGKGAEAAHFEALAGVRHRDSSVVAVDVDR